MPLEQACGGQLFQAPLLPATAHGAQPPALTVHPLVPPGIDLVYADPWLLVLNKPPGLLSVPGRGPDKQDCLSARVQQQFADALVVHRLDMATSGLLIMARTTTVQRALGQAFANRQVHKRYTAVVHGVADHGAAHTSASDWHTIDLPIAPDWPRRPLQTIDPANGKPATTRWRCLAINAQAPTSRLELEPLTGRTHQLRIHLQHTGHPILGDPLYAPPTIVAASNRLLLHASTLGLWHPALEQTMQWDSPAPF